ncbi:MAG: glycosyltransferase [Desulfobacteraceae bacterium]|nr:MAG: glycosyltransferase [Desulfobacteraceae bacterium]
MKASESHSPEKRSCDHNRFPFFVVAFLLILLCVQGGFRGYIGEHPIHFPAGGFILLFGATWILCLLLFFFFPKEITVKNGMLLILVLSLLARVALLPHAPSDDVNRYLWEGKLIHQGISPYTHAPDHAVLSDLAAGDFFHAGINHPDLPAAYPPLILILFSIAGSICYSPYTVKALVLLFDMGTVFLILRLLQQRGLGMRWSLLYALNPVVLYAFSAHGHFDVIQHFFIIGSLVWFEKKSWIPMFLFAGLAVQSKYVAAVAIPFLVNRRNYPFAVFALVAAAAPFFGIPDTGVADFFYSLQKFGEEYAFNGSIHGLLRAAFGEIQPATMICKIGLCMLLVSGLGYFHPETDSRFQNDPLSGIFFSLGAVLLLMPTVHFWYITWIIPLLPFRPSKAWLVLCASISFYFVGMDDQTGIRDFPVWAQILVWLPFYLVLIREGYLLFQRGRSRFGASLHHSLSVIIPAKNEESHIRDCIRSIRSDRSVREIVVVDGGSDDNTAAAALQEGAVVIEHPDAPGRGGGRGGQIRRGILSAQGDIIAVVHADVRPACSTFTEIRNLLEKNPDIIGGAVGGVFDDADRRLRIVEWLNEFRALVFSIGFGDQIQFFRKQPVVEKDLFPDIPLMEDVELSLRLNQAGRQIYLFGNARISSRRWKAAGIRNGFSVVKRMVAFLRKRKSGLPDTVSMYRSYYPVDLNEDHPDSGKR